MNTEQILKGNKMVAKFDGWVLIPESDNKFVPEHYERGQDWMDNINNLKYHTSWDWLMPVVQKILTTNTGTLDVYSLYVSDSLRTANIDDVYESVIDFLTWYPTPSNKPKQ